MSSVDAHIVEYDQTYPNGSGLPLIMGETNSLFNEGKPGLSNSFGAALWGIDFNLYCASVGFKRVHMHMGTNYRVSRPLIHTHPHNMTGVPPLSSLLEISLLC